MARKPVTYLMLLFGAAMLSAAVPPLRSQDQQPESSSKPAQAPPQDKPHKKSQADSATQNAPDQPVWDPLRAEKDLEVGQYYMRRGDLDAAMDRFQDATTAKPGFAIPFRYLGEAEEKKKLLKRAIASYSRYLELVPHADDAEKIRKRIEKLRAQVAKEKK